MKYLSLVIFLLSCTAWGKGSSYTHHCYSQLESIKKAEAMKYDRCQYRRDGDNLVGLCTNWEGENTYKTVDIDYFKEKRVPMYIPSTETLSNLGKFNIEIKQ